MKGLSVMSVLGISQGLRRTGEEQKRTKKEEEVNTV